MDAVARNLARGRLMLLVAGDGIREGTESIVQYVGRDAGLHLTFGLVEVAGYEMPDGRLLVQPRVLARTATSSARWCAWRGPGPGSPRSSRRRGGRGRGGRRAHGSGGEAGGRRSFDPAVLEADRRWRAEFVRRVRFDDPAQAVGRAGYGRVFLELPVPWAWMTAYSARSGNRVGNTLVLKGDAGRGSSRRWKRSAAASRPNSRPRATAATRMAPPRRPLLGRSGPDLRRRVVTAEQEPEQLEWLLGATDAFVNAFRPRVLRLLPRDTSV